MSSSDEDHQEHPIKEPDPSKVNWYFQKTGKSLGDGVLITHNSHNKFYRQNPSRDGKTLW